MELLHQRAYPISAIAAFVLAMLAIFAVGLLVGAARAARPQPLRV
ncbi:exported hypothetical protein [Paraburkholderia ribeironis]|uniref:Uncharacterized protein n=1 Tax=Paraburkholderia ribeironis TaxID=1247936 RepID=A0A1N7SDH5_9BURK|nr:hypothetical protein [Paraburkholderia ribeironis]SIT45457.1 exported hypothetical protein [Paraburkholderia ribeironis]